MKSNHLSVEVFRDFQTPDVSLESAEAAVESLRRYTDKIVIGAMNRKIKIGERETIPKIGSINFPYSAMQADMNLILSDRLFEESEPDIATDGIALHHPIDGVVRRVAIVSVAISKNATIAGAHELGHLLNLKKTGVTHDGHGHCLSPVCIMHESLDGHNNQGSQLRDKLDSLFARHDHPSQPEHRSIADMCHECAEQLGQNAFWLLRAKNGEMLPPGYEL